MSGDTTAIATMWATAHPATAGDCPVDLLAEALAEGQGGRRGELDADEVHLLCRVAARTWRERTKRRPVPTTAADLDFADHHGRRA